MKNFVALSLVSSLLFSACAEMPADDEGMDIVTSIAPIYSLTANLVEGVEGVTLENLVPPNISVHSYALTPEKAKMIEESELMIVNGLGLEEFLENSIEGKNVLVASNGIETITAEEHEDEDEDEDEHEDEHEHGPEDPHVWLSPQNAKIQAANIANELMSIDPKNANAYQLNLEKLQNELDDLENDLSSDLATVQIDNYLVFHNAYAYFEKAFGIKALAYLEEFPGDQPSIEYLAGIIDLVEEQDVKVIFTEPQFSPSLVESLSDDYGLLVKELDPLGKVSKDGYFDFMRANAAVFVEVFK